MDRSEWDLAFALLGGRGWRPQRIQDGLVVHRGDESALTVREAGDGLAVTLIDAHGLPAAAALPPAANGAALVAWIADLLAQHPEAVDAADAPVAHFPPSGEIGRAVLTLAYAAYRPELDALAEEGVHAYLEDDGSQLRIFGDLAPSLLLDVSLDDAGVPPLGPGAGDWTIYLTTPDGEERELVVARGPRREDDARELAAAVAAALAQTP